RERRMHATNETRRAMTGAGGHYARARRALAVDGGPQGPRGPVGPAPGDVGSAAPDRQPHGVLRRRDGGPVRGGPPADPCGALHPGFVPGRVYDNVVRGLRPPWVAGVYVAAAALLGLHLFHGLWAAARSLGARPDAAAARRRPAVAALSAAVALGFASVPIAVLAGWLR